MKTKRSNLLNIKFLVVMCFVLFTVFTVYAANNNQQFYRLQKSTGIIAGEGNPHQIFSLLEEHGKCRVFDTNTCDKDVFIPTLGSAEFDSFLNHKPSCVSAHACAKRRDGTFTGTTLTDYDCRWYKTSDGSFVQQSDVASMVSYYNACVSPARASPQEEYTIYCRNPSVDSSHRVISYITWHQNGLWSCNMYPPTHSPNELY